MQSRYIKGEVIHAGDTDREIVFGFVSCSCRACERAGKAKLCGRVKEECLSTLGVRMVRCTPGLVVPLRFFCYLNRFVCLFHTDRCYLWRGLFVLLCF